MVLFVLSKSVTVYFLTDYKKDGSWDELNYLGYYYDNYINNNRSFLVLGLYEYTARDIYLYFCNLNKTYGSVEEIEEIIAKILSWSIMKMNILVFLRGRI